MGRRVGGGWGEGCGGGGEMVNDVQRRKGDWIDLGHVSWRREEGG